MNTETIEAFDVYVGADVIREIHHTPGVSVFQSFGEDWTNAPIVQIHPPSPKQQGPGTPALAPQESRPLQKCHYDRAFKVIILVLTGLCFWAMLGGW
jgi:hypothetical protein